MKKILSLILVAIIATTSLFAINVRDISAVELSPTSLPNIRLNVDAFESGALTDALVELYYGTNLHTDADALENTAWHLGDAIATDYETDVFTVKFTSGLVNASSTATNDDTNYKITVTPGPFVNGSTTATTDGTTDFKPIATYVAIGTTNSVAGAAVLDITSPPVPINYYISGMDLASFKLEWESVPFNVHVNAEGTYTSTSVVNISSI